MTDERTFSFEGEATLRRMLRDLGGSETNLPRGAEAESAREQRMAASMDAELSRLVAGQRRGRRFGGAALAAAAALLVAFGARQWLAGGAALAISQEPLAVKAWKAPSSAAALPDSPVEPDSTPQRLHAPPRVSAAALPSSPTAAASVVPAPQSTLAEENQWFKEAAEASRNGDVNGALGRLEQLLREHPQSPLAQTALVRKFRLLAKAGRSSEAQSEAKRYLGAYPTGFAVAEAQAIEQGTASPSAPLGEERGEP